MYKELGEQELARYCCEKDRMAENELYTRYAARVYALCRRYIKDEDEAKDLMQEALIQALGKIQTFRYTGKGSLYNWLSRIAINKAVDQIRKRKWQLVSWDFWTHDDIPEPTEDETEGIPQEKMLEWIDNLPDFQRSVFNLYCIDGYSHKEIGKMLGISERGSTSILAKARKQLKEEVHNYLKEQGK